MFVAQPGSIGDCKQVEHVASATQGLNVIQQLLVTHPSKTPPSKKNIEPQIPPMLLPPVPPLPPLPTEAVLDAVAAALLDDELAVLAPTLPPVPPDVSESLPPQAPAATSPIAGAPKLSTAMQFQAFIVVSIHGGEIFAGDDRE